MPPVTKARRIPYFASQFEKTVPKIKKENPRVRIISKTTVLTPANAVSRSKHRGLAAKCRPAFMRCHRLAPAASAPRSIRI